MFKIKVFCLLLIFQTNIILSANLSTPFVDWGWGAAIIKEPNDTLSLYESTNNNTAVRPNVATGVEVRNKHIHLCHLLEQGINKGNLIYTPNEGSILWIWNSGTSHAYQPEKALSNCHGIQPSELDKTTKTGKTFYDTNTYILLSTGVDGLLGVNESIVDQFVWKQIIEISPEGHEKIIPHKAKGEKILIIGRTSQIIDKANQLQKNGEKKFVVFVHTTC